MHHTDGDMVLNGILHNSAKRRHKAEDTSHLVGF